MAGTLNCKRIIVGGILGGVAWNVWGMVINMAFLGQRYAVAQAAREFLPQARYPFFIGFYMLIIFLVSIGVAWLYAATRSTLGPGPASALKVGLVVGIIASVPENFAQSAWAPISRYFPLGWLLESLVGCILAALLAGWYYRD